MRYQIPGFGSIKLKVANKLNNDLTIQVIVVILVSYTICVTWLCIKIQEIGFHMISKSSRST